MTVYVDDVRHQFGRMVMCHMWADTEEELLAMADAIGVARKWIQGHPTLSFGKHRNASWVHFDISLGCKAKALALGAVLTDKFGPVEHTSRLYIAHAERTGNKDMAERNQKMLDRIMNMRARAALKGSAS